MQLAKKWGRRLLWLLPALAAAVFYLVLPHFPRFTETVFSRGIFRGLVTVLGGPISVLPFSLTEVLAVLAIPVLLFLLVRLILALRPSRRRARPGALGRAWRAAGWTFSCALLFYMLLHGLNFYRLPVADLMGLDTSPKSVALLKEATIYYARQATAAREGLSEDENGCMALSQPLSDTLKLAGQGYDVLDETYPFLWGAVNRVKPVQLSHWWSYTGITGMYFPLLAEANVNIDVPANSLPATALHELAHTRGFAREDEANFLSCLVGFTHPSADYRYSACLQAYLYCANALYGYDVEAWQEARSLCSEGVLRDLQQRSAYWAQFEGPVQAVSTAVNDSFIKAQGVDDGVHSYGRAVNLLLSYFESEKDG